MPVQIKSCNCHTGSASDFQDKEYGKGRRLCNDDTKNKCTCSCCGKKH